MYVVINITYTRFWAMITSVQSGRKNNVYHWIIQILQIADVFHNFYNGLVIADCDFQSWKISEKKIRIKQPSDVRWTSNKILLGMQTRIFHDIEFSLMTRQRG